MVAPPVILLDTIAVTGVLPPKLPFPAITVVAPEPPILAPAKLRTAVILRFELIATTIKPSPPIGTLLNVYELDAAVCVTPVINVLEGGTALGVGVGVDVLVTVGVGVDVLVTVGVGVLVSVGVGVEV